MALGWAVAGEPLTARTLLAMGVIISAVLLIVSAGTTAGGRGAGRAAARGPWPGGSRRGAPRRPATGT
ncbi:MAG TPA: hypothetical protein VFC61_04460 [Blastocatellia bacterium]|nr:hypothetical protein [Blastocatellia bacterium]